MRIALKDIRESPFQTRASMNGQPLAELVASMNDVGQAVPVKVRPILTRALDQQYETVYGHRRIEAAKRLGWDEIEAVVDELTDEQAMLQGLVENVQRDDLEPMEEARAFKRLQDEFGWSGERIAKEIGKNAVYVQRHLRLLEEPDTVQEKVKKGIGGDATDGRVTEFLVREVRASGVSQAEGTSIIKKAAREELTAKQARQVAEAVKASENAETKKELLGAKYDPIIHTPEFAKQQDHERAKSKKEPKPPADLEWKNSLDVIRIVEFTNAWKKSIPQMRKATEVGKLAPEACQYMATKLRQLVGLLEDFISELDERANA